MTMASQARSRRGVRIFLRSIGPELISSASDNEASALAAIAQTPVVSQFFGCSPLGPLGWTIGAGAAATATEVSVLTPRVIARIGRSHSSVLGETWDLEELRTVRARVGKW